MIAITPEALFDQICSGNENLLNTSHETWLNRFMQDSGREK